MGCGTSTIKYLLFFFNLIFAIGGVAILVLGSIMQYNMSTYGQFLEFKSNAVPIILIVVGSLIFIISFFGCWGAIQESHCMLITFAIMLLVIFLAQLVLGILALVYQLDIDDELHEIMKNLLQRYGDPNDDTPKVAWDLTQQTLRCCGVDNAGDWLLSGQQVPGSCQCDVLYNEECLLGYFTKGCFPALRDFLHVGQLVLGAVAISIAVIEMLGVIFAFCLASSIMKSQHMIL